MKNWGLIGLKDKGVDDFTTDAGIRIRRFINPLLRKVLALATKRKIVVWRYSKLHKGKPYIFASTHSFDEDIIAYLARIDRNAYVLLGTTDQLEHNPQMYAAWLNGLVYVDRGNEKSRKDSVKKMERLLRAGSSVLLFPEGGWNNTENLLCLPLFAGPWTLSKAMKTSVVPVAAFHEHDADVIYLGYGEPMELFRYEKREALGMLRDEMANMIYESMEKYASTLTRLELMGDTHLNYLEERRQEYMRVKWTRDSWDEELTTYCKKGEELPKDVCRFVENVYVDKDNAGVLAPYLVEHEKHKKYDLKTYLRENCRI